MNTWDGPWIETRTNDNIGEPSHARERRWQASFEIRVNSRRPVMRGVLSLSELLLTMESASDIAKAIMQLPERNRSGTLRMFGDWFGRPMDNVHRVTDAKGDVDCLILSFNNAEILSVWNPSGYSTIAYTIQIADADRVRWEWYYYGRDHVPENLLFHDYRKSEGQIIVVRTHGGDNPGASIHEPAVELIGM